VRVVLCGRGVIDNQLLSQYRDLSLEIHIGLPRNELVRHIQASDIFVLPSLAEGFAHAILEAMACGLPVLATSHTCAPDVMRDSEHGFIVPIRDASAIADRLTWAMEHRLDLGGVGKAPSQQAATYQWKRFRRGVRDAYAEMLRAI